LIELKNVTKKYGQNYAVRDVSFRIEKGEIVGFLGRNGAGKTTTMNIVTGYISSTEGIVTVDGFDILKNPREAKQRIGYLPELPPLYPDLTVEEYLSFACRLKGVGKAEMAKQVDRVLETANVSDVKKRLIGNLSKGYRQRVGLAQALCGHPEVIILDEPTVGLDPRQIMDFRNTIKELGKDHTVILSSHILNEVADVCEKVIIIDKGRIVKQESLKNLTQGLKERPRVLVRLTGTEEAGQKLLKNIPGATAVESAGQKEAGAFDFVVEGAGKDLREDIYEAVKSSALRILLMQPVSQTLEDIFINLTNGGEEAV
jgi:ABC-2 type transport system ATP-binding protein